MPQMTYEDLLTDLCSRNENIVVMTAENRAAIRTLPPKIGNRFIDVGISEQTMIGAAAGLALRGRIPIVHALATFLTLRGYEFIRTDIGIGNLPVKLVGAVPGLLSDGNGPTHQAVEDVAVMRIIPPMNVFCPADEEDMLIGLPSILQDRSPWYIRYNSVKPVIEHDPAFEAGRAEIIGDGSDVAFLVYGFLFGETLTAVRVLESRGIRCRLLNLRTVKPIDQSALLQAARECKLLCTVEDHFLTGGLYSILADILLRNERTAHVLPIALENRWFKPALLRDVIEFERLTGNDIAAKALDALEHTGTALPLTEKLFH